MSGRVTRTGSAIALAATAHSVFNARLLRRPVADPPPVRTAVSVLVPARDEAHQIEACLRSLLAQVACERIEIVVLDDESADRTAEIARSLADGRSRLTVLNGAPLPRGWLGKPHACAQLAGAAAPDSELLIFVDADVVLAPRAVAAAVELLERTGLDVVCPYPRQLAETGAERLVQPLLQWSWLTFLPLRLAERSRRPSLSAANGQFLVVRRAAYERAGGHAAVRAEVLDDIALLRAIKATGGRGGVVDGTGLASCRMYRDWPEVRFGYTKSLAVAFGSEPGAAAVIALLALAYLVPPLAALRGSRTGWLGFAAAVAGRFVTARATGGRCLPDSAAHPLSIALLAALTGRSILGRRRGNLTWKDRPVGPVAG